MIGTWTLRPSWADIDRWIEYFRRHVPMTAERAALARELLIEWLRQIGQLPIE